MLAFTIPPLLLPARESTIVICNRSCSLPSWFPLSLIWLEAGGSMMDIRVVCWGFSPSRKFLFFGNSIVLSIHSLWFAWVCGLLSEEEKLLWFFGHRAGCTVVGLMTWRNCWAFLLPIHFDYERFPRSFVYSHYQVHFNLYVLYIKIFRPLPQHLDLLAEFLLTLLTRTYWWCMSSRCWRLLERKWPSTWRFE